MSDGPVEGTLHRVLIRQGVREDARAEYEGWLRQLHAELERRPGFQSVEVMRQREEGLTQFMIVASFTSEAHLEQWLRSPELSDLRGRLDGIAGSVRSVTQVTGREIWFDGTAGGQAAYWKRVLLTAVCVLPTIYFTEFLLDLVGLRLPPFLHQVVSVVVLCAMLTWPIMPVATRLLGGWLRPVTPRASTWRDRG